MSDTYNEAMRAGWEMRRDFIQSDAVTKVDVLRYTISGRDAATGKAGTKTLVSDLSNLDAVVEELDQRTIQLSNGKFDYRDKWFVFFDQPEDIDTQDQITHAGSLYDVYSYTRVQGTGMLRVLGKRVQATATAKV